MWFTVEKNDKINHPPLYFNQNFVKSSSTYKHLGMVLDTRLDFSLHLDNVQNKANKTIEFLRKLYRVVGSFFGEGEAGGGSVWSKL